jgi:hypothetical protein
VTPDDVVQVLALLADFRRQLVAQDAVIADLRRQLDLAEQAKADHVDLGLS